MNTTGFDKRRLRAGAPAATEVLSPAAISARNGCATIHPPVSGSTSDRISPVSVFRLLTMRSVSMIHSA